MHIKTIIFDFGNVLYHPPSWAWFKRISKVLGLKENPHLEALITDPDGSDYLRDVFAGKISENEMWAEAVRTLGMKPAHLDLLHKRFSTKQRLNKRMVRLLQKLHLEYQTAILSNAGDQTRALIVDSLGLDQWVEEIIISAEEGMVKPDPEIYELTLNRLSAKAENCLFVDDQLQNVEAAKALGMQAIQFTSNDQTIPAIHQLLGQEV
jgi:putative hydrolase of the HAD superfamily